MSSIGFFSYIIFCLFSFVLIWYLFPQQVRQSSIFPTLRKFEKQSKLSWERSNSSDMIPRTSLLPGTRGDQIYLKAGSCEEPCRSLYRTSQFSKTPKIAIRSLLSLLLSSYKGVPLYPWGFQITQFPKSMNIGKPIPSPTRNYGSSYPLASRGLSESSSSQICFSAASAGLWVISRAENHHFQFLSKTRSDVINVF